MTDATADDHRSPRLQLAIETTGKCGSIAILRDDVIIRAINLPETTRTAASLAVHLDDILKQHRDGSQPIELVSVADGPGSFTGLRIGVTTAKSLCYALKIPLIAVDSLAAVAASAFHQNPSAQSVCVGIDAYRQQVFAGCFRRKALLDSPERLSATWTPHPSEVQVLSASQWEAYLSHIGKPKPPTPASDPAGPSWTTNPSFSSQPNGLAAASTAPEIWFAAGDDKPFQQSKLPMLSRQCDAIGVGLLAWRAFRLGLTTDPIALVPRYLKPSAAEEQAKHS